MRYYVYARRYSKNGNKTYSYLGFMIEKDVQELMNKVYNNSNSVWFVSINKEYDND